MDITSYIKSKLDEFRNTVTTGYNKVADALPLVPNTSQIQSFVSSPVQYMTNPKYNSGNNIYSTSPFQVSGAVQNFIESPKSTSSFVPRMPIIKGASGWNAVANYGVNPMIDFYTNPVTKGIIDPTLDAGANIGRTLTGRPLLDYQQAKSPITKAGYQLANTVLPSEFRAPADTNMSFRDAAGNAGGIASPIIDAAMLNIGGHAVKDALGNTVKSSLKSKVFQGAKTLAPYGLASGVASSLDQNRNTTGIDYIKNVLADAAVGTVGAAVMGAGGALVGELGSKVFKAFKESTPGANVEQAGKAFQKFARDEIGRFVGKDSVPTQWIEDAQISNKQRVAFRKALGLPLDGNYGRGSVDLNAKVDTGIFKSPYERGDIGKIQAELENMLGVPPDAGFKQKQSTLGQNYAILQQAADAGAPGAPEAVARAKELFSAIELAQKGKTAAVDLKLNEPIGTQIDRTQLTGRQLDMTNEQLASFRNRTPITQDTQIGRTSGTPQELGGNTQSQTVSPAQTRQPESPPQPPKSGVSKIGEPPVESSSQGIIDNVKNYANRLYTQAVDRFHPLSQVAKQAGEDQAMRNALTQHYGSGSTANYHVDFELAPILKSVDANDLRSYTIAKRDIELASRNIKGSDKNAALEVINQLKTKYGPEFGKIESAASNLYAYQDSLVKKYLVDSGVISKNSYEAMRKNNQSYIPFKRVMDQVDTFLGVTPQAKGAGSVDYQGVIKNIKGSNRDIIDPLQSIVENTYKIVSVGQRNRVAQTIVSLKSKLPDIIKPFMGEAGNRRDIISVFENGTVKRYQVPKDVAEAAKGLNEEALNALVKILSVPSKLVRATATGLNPEFLLPNVARDLQSAFVNVGLNPLRFVRGVSHLLNKDMVYQDFLRSGGKTSSIMIDRAGLQNSVQELTSNAGTKFGLQILHPIKLLQTLGEYSEQPTRIAIFDQIKSKLLKEGLSVAEAELRAANAAQEGTVNFARMGSKMKAANSLITFLNARLQGSDLLIRNIKNNPASTLFRLGLVSQVPAVLSYLYNRQFNSYNDERVVSKYDKQNNFILMLSDTPVDQLGGAQFIKIPKGDVGRFANPTESFMSYLDGKKDNNTILEIAKAFGGLSPFQNIGDAIPAAIKPPIEWAANKSFFTDQALVPDYKQALPAKYQFTSKTAPLYKMIGDKLNLSPAKLENTTAGYLTGFEKLGNAAFNVATGQKSDLQQGSEINRVPIARRFLGGEKRTSDEQAIMDEKKANSIDFQITDIKGAVNRGDLPATEGIKQIELLRQQQLDIRNKQVNNSLVGAGNTVENTQSTTGKTYYFKDAEGKLKEINISSLLQAPTLTGNVELDKKLMSKYNSAISKRANDIESLYSAGQITSAEAEKQLNELKQKKMSSYKGRTVKASKQFRARKVKAVKVKFGKFKSFKFPKVAKLKKYKVKKLTARA